jgi:hypothetical protein
MLTMLWLSINLVAAVAAFVVSQRFVEKRLRYVDAVQRPYAPFVAGGAAALIALPVVALLPVVTTFTALLVGAGVFAGVSTGAREIRRRLSA